MNDIRDMQPGDYVKTGRARYEKIAAIHGVSPGGALAKPSAGGFSVTTESGKRVSMWQARSYHKKHEIEN